MQQNEVLTLDLCLFVLVSWGRYMMGQNAILNVLFRCADVLLAAFLWSMLGAHVALMGSTDPEKKEALLATGLKGPSVYAVPTSAAISFVVCLLCSALNLGALEIFIIELCVILAVFRYLWRGGAGPSNQLIYGDPTEGVPCGFCGQVGCNGACCV
ncbi:hypothetical protein GUITHDRAFT_121801 [Guillardia theta CCMP2712]|uniref:Uncharacterized protein n=1 Tax=Guillardia theta (strain CCMP2712) TaxID=905079 RepID=L1I804_GUITC|nr:hypothetical protein GUITHDRAFT_121801 [Guillardia theta CCMP2712]EKX32034.1 hypothetical protein GUITHDRAFT_121801 [Guillardia theta CCMP2712]|eukprot:XP_005819014.1 hypothetical protein GUITHDRAFT_121801 [Guillardia theta CCMP2712]